ncbi:hypothetical protein FRX31_014760 [Thalictrum thalictroides]|uniref:Uncharacterized protein n=1 Tax=Thalictrum thalictroides TaxID=46969 RepID=A0A7J6WDZ3_THATH|nr:hypothetical protein FRX31_014760 [Thalictrum thalictroides]
MRRQQVHQIPTQTHQQHMNCDMTNAEVINQQLYVASDPFLSTDYFIKVPVSSSNAYGFADSEQEEEIMTDGTLGNSLAMTGLADSEQEEELTTDGILGNRLAMTEFELPLDEDIMFQDFCQNPGDLVEGQIPFLTSDSAEDCW